MKRSAITIAVALPCAVVAAWIGFMIEAFISDLSVGVFSFHCWLL
ncbi:hypothetical protein [Bythopirellula polymerisocia]|nr:hypothetical protein [Bythopirellula polymerisocia]